MGKGRTISIVMLLLVGVAFTVSAAGTQQAVSADVVYEYDWATANNHRRIEDNACKKWTEEHFNIKINWITTDNQVAKLNVLMAAGDIPDMMTIGMDLAGLATYADQGVLAELPLSMVRQHMPGYMTEYLGGFDVDDVWKFSEVDGKNMGLPKMGLGGNIRNAITWNAQWLLNVGISSIPETLGEFEAAFRAFRENDPDQNGKKDTYAMTAPGDWQLAPEGFFQEFFGAFGTFPFEWIEDNGKLVYGFTDPGTKEALALLAKWYADELIDPEWVTEIARKDGANDVAWKFANDKIGYVSTLGADDSQWDGGGHLNRKWDQARPDQWKYIWSRKCRPEPGCKPEDWLYSNYGFTKIDPSAHEGYHPYVNGEPPVGPGGESGMSVGGLVPSFVTFGRHLENEQPKYIRLLQVLDELSSDIDTYYNAAKGKADLHFEWIEWDKPPVYKYAVWTEYRLTELQNYFSDYSGGGSTNPFWVSHWWYMPAGGPQGFQRMKTRETIGATGTVEQALKVTLPSAVEYADLDKPLDEFFYKVILGQQSVEDWDAIVAAWKRNGGDTLTKEANDWYAKTK